ncbi:precorrin-6y C5,15-methyltransferase (decarboxylating) subunit CbiE [Ferroplasma acidiphilum]|uniref:Precorrin-6y C5,15-methyltransferase (Decarboxylating) subunit CbiE n=1 Tax=Ferroplasma acidiphilum TaxID=74969 RepID=A0A7K4FKN2_9ARCH|nr:precorrin-6y C5,15-methyltransferase (decarboxylating) subunit CbiE [Ferroplasma acidiphilum]MCL4349153.1 precorrin-6y C5,15-methyltransferase (decarboxylating) subunit CbiE [Candidatus Thermoplasmatota archaeon]NOL59600.1 precorrin-6y C5,15-methyltransferase (decarboxylating) subunit CbiE [Ferroplasma acidiphilum]WMT53164.1 MAG: precorrin-6y C5,15-methyltransferase (decarboxylating) subunit CbiE [Ferroplasma acidiphilum]
MKRINIVGVFPGRPINPEAEKCIMESQVIFSGRRNLELIPQTPAQIFNIGSMKQFTGDLANTLADNKTVTVVASGDPLFFGIGKYITEHYDSGDIYIVPEVSSLQVALSRLGMDASHMVAISLHGREIKGLAQKIRNKRKIAIFTDGNNTPSRIAEYMTSFGLVDYSSYVLERLGYKDESISKYKIKELIGKEFNDLNIMILIKDGNGKISLLDDGVLLRKNNNITKKEIREISISELDLNNGDTMWDVGSGSGSVAIYASLINPDGNIFAIEKDKALCNFIDENMRKFSTDINIINGEAPEALDGIPDPEAVFIGGSSGNIKNIVKYCYVRLKDGGRMVANITTMENFYAMMNYIKENNLQFDVKQVNISRLKPVSVYTRFEPLDQIYIVKVVKK